MATKRASLVPESLNPLKMGASVFIRTISMYYTGKVLELTAEFIVLEDAAWIADTGRFSSALTDGVLGEVEPYPDPVSVNRAHVLDVTRWGHALPRDVK